MCSTVLFIIVLCIIVSKYKIFSFVFKVLGCTNYRRYSVKNDFRLKSLFLLSYTVPIYRGNIKGQLNKKITKIFFTFWTAKRFWKNMCKSFYFILSTVFNVKTCWNFANILTDVLIFYIGLTWQIVKATFNPVQLVLNSIGSGFFLKLGTYKIYLIV